MANIRTLTRRIHTVRSMAQVTRAMQLVSASRMRRAVLRLSEAMPYATKMGELVGNLVGSVPWFESHPLLTHRPVQHATVVVVGSDRGLVGGYNSAIARLALRFGQSLEVPVSYVAVGRQARRAILAAGEHLTGEFEGIPTDLELSDAAAIARFLEESFLSGETDAAFFAYTNFVSVGTQAPTVAQILPIPPRAAGDAGGSGARGESMVPYIYEPGESAILDRLLPHALDVQIYGYLANSSASEHSGRMIAMQSANDNAQKQDEELTRLYNRARQTAITNEILDIAGATEALVSAS